MRNKSVKVSVNDLHKISIIPKEGVTKIYRSGKLQAVFEDYTVISWKDGKDYGIEFKVKGIEKEMRQRSNLEEDEC